MNSTVFIRLIFTHLIGCTSYNRKYRCLSKHQRELQSQPAVMDVPLVDCFEDKNVDFTNMKDIFEV